MTGSGNGKALGSCPICDTPTVQQYRPFCSKRCADVDLNRWLSGGYAIPARDDDPGEDDFGGESPNLAGSGSTH